MDAKAHRKEGVRGEEPLPGAGRQGHPILARELDKGTSEAGGLAPDPGEIRRRAGALLALWAAVA